MLKLLKKFFEIPNISSYDRNVHYLISFLVLTVTAYDIFVLGFELNLKYFAVRTAFILSPYIFSFVFREHSWGQFTNDFLIFNYFIYSGYYSYFYSYAYIFSFAQFGLGMAGILKLSRKFYTPLLLFGATLAYISIFYSPMFHARNNEQAIKVDYLSSIVYVFFVSYFVFHRSLKQKEQALTQELVFANIGKRLSVVLHELQGTLKRFDHTNNSSDLKEVQDIKDINKLLSILAPSQKGEMLETLTTEDLKELVLEVLDSQDDYVKNLGINIKCQLDSHITTLDRVSFKITFKNLIKNALEELVHHEREMRLLEVKLTSSGESFELTIRNMSRQQSIKPSDLLKPFVSHKSNITNNGLGLYIVDTLCKRMNLNLNILIKEKFFCVTLNNEA